MKKVFQGKILIITIFIDLILLICVSFIMNYVRELLYTDARINLTEIVTQNRDAIVSRLALEVNNLNLVAKQVSDGIGGSGKPDAASIYQSFFKYSGEYDNDPNLYCSDTEGNAVYSHGEKINIMGRRYFQLGLEGKENVSERTVSRMNGSDIFVICVPLKYSGEIVGTIQKQYTPEQMYDICAAPLFAENGSTYIINSQGYILINSDHSEYSRESDNYFRLIYLSDPEASKKLENDIAAGQPGFMMTIVNGEKLFSAYTPIDEVDDWFLISRVAVSAVSPNSSIVINLFYIVLLAVVLFFACIMFYYLYSKRKQKERLEHLAFVDPITGGISFTKFSIDMKDVFNKSPNKKYYIFVFDIDNFKYINSFYGFRMGDKILKQLYETYHLQLLDDELIARTHGDHFILLLSDASEERLQSLFTSEISLYDVTIYIAAGLYAISDKNESVNLMADKASVAAKRLKGMRHKAIEVYSEEINQNIAKNEQIKRAIEDALIHGEIIPYFQPKVDINTGRLAGAEALARWRLNDGKIIPPGEFIPVCEQTGLINLVDMTIFEQTLKFIRSNLDCGINCTPISVNFSKMHLLNVDFLQTILQKLKEYNVPPELIELELTETVIFDNHKWINDFISNLHEVGVQVSMDDFGSGYSSLHMLKEVEIDVLKIDRGFLKDTVDSDRQRVIFGAIVQMAKSLHMKVVVEGVETTENISLMKEFGCSIAQGFYYSRPVDSVEFQKIYAAGSLELL